MSSYIDKQRAYELLKFERDSHILSSSYEAYSRACRIIDQLPSVDLPIIRYGFWEDLDSSFDHVYCSECGAASDRVLAKKYLCCPFCMCLMR